MLLIAVVISIIYKIDFSPGRITISERFWNPVWLFMGPFLYFSNLSLKTDKRGRWPHLLPGAVFFLVFISLLTFNTQIPGRVAYWYKIAGLLAPISLFGYAPVVLWERVRSVRTFHPGDDLLVMTSGFFILISLLIILFSLCSFIPFVETGIDYRWFVFAFLIVIALSIVRYFYILRKLESRERTFLSFPEGSYTNSALTTRQATDYVRQIRQYFDRTDAYLRPDLSLEVLSKELNIPKHILSQVFNVYIGRNFYGVLAEYRIGYSLRRLDSEREKLTIESLAYDCGFNSKTSFNRYFKKITGYTPLEYLRALEAERNISDC